MIARIRTLLVDDTRLARVEMRTLLAAHADVDIVGEADDVGAAIDAIDHLRPDCVLLDIQMPSGTGFDVLERIDHAPLVVFSTAYDQHAVRAFDANALDYVVKPVEPARLAGALDRVRARLRTGTAPLIEATSTPATLGLDAQVFLRDGERCWFVSLADISRIVVDGNYARVWFKGEQALLMRSLSALESRLDADVFFRANRNTLVNLRHVRGVDLSVGDGYTLSLRDGAEVDVSRRQARELRERLAL